MKKHLRQTSMRLAFLVFLLNSASLLAQQSVASPYFTGFESEADTAGWTFVKRGSLSPSEWYWGSAVRENGSKSMYISADQGQSAGYAENTMGYYVVAYKCFSSLPAGDYELAFDCRVGGTVDSVGSLLDGLTVAWIPGSALSSAPKAGIGSNLPVEYTLNPFLSYYGESVFADCGWRNVMGQVSVSARENEYYLVFIWKTDGGTATDFSTAVDNVQLAVKYPDEDCAARPLDIAISHTDAGDIEISWIGNAASYELKYYRCNTLEPEEEHLISGISSPSYLLPLSELTNGVYSIYVRSICDEDTSLWSKLSNAFLYDVTAYCLDYLNFNAEGVECTYGNFSNPYQYPYVRDYGYTSAKSVHTVHYLQNEYDPRTLGRLKTVPPDAIASVRLNNWTENGATSGSITYTYTVTEDADVLKFRYAAVLQYARHHPPSDQTRIVVEILDARTGEVLSECTKSDFNAKNVDEDKVRGWNRIEYSEFPAGTFIDTQKSPVLWCDWTTIGINLDDYVGMTLKIRITLRSCGADYHFAYAYFTLDCGRGEIEGVSCGEHPEVFRVPEGFLYEWYRTYDPDRTIVGTADSLLIAPDDTASYSVDLIFPENDRCYFTLRASALPREPVAALNYIITVDSCRNIIRFDNRTEIFGFWEGDTIPTGNSCRAYIWDFGSYGTSTDFEPEITVPAAGDTFLVTLTASIDSDMKCSDTKSFTVRVPSILPDTTRVSYTICEGASAVHDGHEYTAPGRKELHYTSSLTGCDSVVIIEISMIETDTIADTLTVCTADLPVPFHGQELTAAGHYTHTVSITAGCDSIVHTLDLLVRESLAIGLGTDRVTACADDSVFTLPFRIYEGIPTGYSVAFSTEAHAAGLPDIPRSPLMTDTGALSLPIPAEVLPGTYAAELIFHNGDCGDIRLSLTLDILYPSSILVQRWNDVLALLNSGYNGGYTFSSYQWYKDGVPISGATRPNLYLPGAMDYGAMYSLFLTRARDGVSQFTCPLIPGEYAPALMEVIPTVTFSGGSIEVKSYASASASLYASDGRLVRTFSIVPGGNTLPLRVPTGLYILAVSYGSGHTETVKILVRQ